MGGSSQQPVTQQTLQSRDPWSAAQGPLSLIIGQAGNLFNSDTGYVPYPGSTQASLDPSVALGLASQASIAQNYQGLGGSAGNAEAQQMARNMVQNYGLSPQMQQLYQQASSQNNPYLQGVINQQVNQANAAASGMGRYGSGAHDAAIAQAIAPVLSQDYARRQQQMQDILTGGMTRQGQWAQLQPILEAAQYAPAQALTAVGQYNQDRAQQLLAGQIQQYNAAQARPWEQLSRWNAIVGGAGGLGGSQVTTTPGATQPSTMQRILGGAAAGAGIGSMFAPGIGTGVGALGGGLLGLM